MTFRLGLFGVGIWTICANDLTDINQQSPLRGEKAEVEISGGFQAGRLCASEPLHGPRHAPAEVFRQAGALEN
jgi:hypothetical protein